MNWLSSFYFSYEWSSIKGNGPEDVTMTVLAALVVSVFVPRVRRWWIARAEHLAEHERQVHAKFDHLLKATAHIIAQHPDIDNVHADGTDMTVVPDFTKPQETNP
jgi:hypothetical protein